MRRGRTTGQLSTFLFTRGLWLIFLELTILRFGLLFTFSGPVILTVLWALSVAVIALHNLADPTRYAFGGDEDGHVCGVSLPLNRNTTCKPRRQSIPSPIRSTWISGAKNASSVSVVA